MTEKGSTYQGIETGAPKASKGRDMIEFRVALWTDHENEQPGQCWSSGKVTRSANHRHRIRHGERIINTIAEVGPAIEDLAAEAEITIHPSAKAKGYAQNRDRAVLEEAIVAAMEASD